MPAPLKDIVQKMIDAGESEENIASVIKAYKPAKPTGPVNGGPEDYWSGFLHGGVEGAVGGATGFAKGLLPGVGEGVVGTAMLPINLLKEVISTVGGAGHFVDDPQGTLSKIYANLKDVPGKARDAVESAMKLAATDPEAFGKEVGKITGNTEVGIAAARAVPLLPKPLAEKVGSAAEAFGKKASWPLRITGAHQIIGGNVLGGIATMSTPDLMEKGGAKLRAWGEPPPLNESGARTYDFGDVKPPPVRVQARPAPQVVSDRIPVMGASAEESPRVQKVVAAEKVAEDTAARTAQIEAAKTGRQANTPKITETVKAPGQSMTTTYAPAGELNGLSPLEQDLLARSQGRGAAGASRSIADTLAPRTAPTPLQRPAVATAPSGGAAGAISSEELGIRKLDQVLGDRPAVGNGTGEALSADELDRARATIKGSADAPLDVPASKSSRGQSSMAGISANDLKALKQILTENPHFSAEEAAQELVKQRGQRQSMYRSNAGLGQLEQAALDRDTE